MGWGVELDLLNWDGDLVFFLIGENYSMGSTRGLFFYITFNCCASGGFEDFTTWCTWRGRCRCKVRRV